MADGFETIGWILKVEDKATSSIDKITTFVQARIEEAAYSAGNFSDQIAQWGSKRGPLLRSFAGMAEGASRSFGQVIALAKMNLGARLTKALYFAHAGVRMLSTDVQKVVNRFMTTPAGRVAGGLLKTLPIIKKGFESVAFSVQRRLGMFERAAARLKYADAATKVRDIEKSLRGISKIGDPVERARALGEAFEKLKDAREDMDKARTELEKFPSLLKRTTHLVAQFSKIAGLGFVKVAQQAGHFLRKVIDIQSIANAFRDMGGIAGVMLGPFGKLLDLFSPLLDMIVEQVTPAIQTFAAIVETAFGPFSMTLELIAQNLADAIVPYIKPLAVFLELAALQLGTMLADLLKGNPEGIMAGLFDIIKAAKPVLLKLMSTLLTAGKEIGGALMRAVVQVGPALVKVAVELLGALIPLIPPLTRIVVTLLEKVFVPLLLKVAQWLDQNMPQIELWIAAVADLVGQLADRLDDFFGPKLGKYLSDFKLLWIDPIIGFVNGVIGYAQQLVNVFRMEGVFAGLKKMVTDYFGFLGGAIHKLLVMVGLAEEEAEGAGAGLTDALKEAGGAAPLSAEIDPGVLQTQDREEFNKRMRALKVAREGGMAAGGVVTGPTRKLIGEAGPEMVLPLSPDVVERTLAPILPDMKFPALDRLVEIAMSIDRTLSRGTMRVLSMNTETPAQDEDRGMGDIYMAPGMNGGSW